MGDSRNITTLTVEKIAKDRNTTVALVKQSLKDYLNGKSIEGSSYYDQIFEDAAAAWNQPVAEAKQNTLKLL